MRMGVSAARNLVGAFEHGTGGKAMWSRQFSQRTIPFEREMGCEREMKEMSVWIDSSVL